MSYQVGSLLYRIAHRIGHEGNRKYIPSPKTRWESASAGRDNAVNRVPTLAGKAWHAACYIKSAHEAAADDPANLPLLDPMTLKAKGGEG